MLSWIILIIAIAVFCVLCFLLFSQLFGRGEQLPPMMETEDVKSANRLAVEEGNIGDVHLEVVHRGYRMDQVDDLLTALGEKYGFAPTISQLTENSVVLDTNVLTEGEATDGSNEAAHR